ncbi:unnamed protein product [Didymodactylos carnosus]|uniref:Uncharacterized protein n=1 Tax=Didymodactylos carnosus TaxID=1234261 RepID=A0A815Y3E2_9BILA|nr:unnamed protein product [Didymodactylos carnosus]CAF4427091.1 unnamed protein product [Didymodactylos carnosus]
MTEVSVIGDSNKTVFYGFRFGTSDKVVHLTQQQLNRIPYLFTLVTHKDDLSVSQNENGEYLLSHPIEYTWFMSIFRSITSEQPYTLFNEVAEDDNILDTLQLFDYLGIDLFPPPLLKHTSLVLSNPIKTDNGEKCVVYHKANISEARQTAAEFIIALGKNEYNLHDSCMGDKIFSLIRIILSNATVFNSRFRYHTLIVAKEFCYTFFSNKQQRLLPTTQQIVQHRKIDSFIYLYDDDKQLPDNFCNTFAWRGTYVPKEDYYRTDCLSSSSNIAYFSSLAGRTVTSHYTIIICAPRKAGKSTILNELLGLSPLHKYDEDNDYFHHIYVVDDSLSPTSYSEDLSIHQNEQNQKNTEVRSARSRRFNTLPKRSKVDRFKHRFGPKVQKYR